MKKGGFSYNGKIPLSISWTPLSRQTAKLNPASAVTFGTFGEHEGSGTKSPVLKVHKSDGTVRMKREIGLVGAIAMILGTIIGSGIFITPMKVYERAGSSVYLSIAIWIASGLLSTVAAVTYCELGTVVPRSGGEHAYLQAAFKPLRLHPFWGEIPAFLFSFMTVILIKPANLAILCLSFAQYTILPIVKLNGIDPAWTQSESDDYELSKKLIGVACAVLIGVTNILSVKMAARIQIVFTIAKLIACSLIIAIGIYNLSIGQTGSLPTDGFDLSGDISASGIALSLYCGLWSYDGWHSLNYLTEEIINPNRNLPLAIFIGMPLVTFLFAFMNIAYFTVLSPEDLLSNQPVGTLLGDRMLGSYSFVIPVLVALTVYGTAHGSMFTAGRISYVAARDGHLVDVLSYVHIQRLTPAVAILLNTILGILFIYHNSIGKLLDSTTISAWIFYALTMISFFILRHTQRDTVRPFKTPILFPSIALAMSLFLVVTPLVDSPGFEHVYPIVLCGMGIAIYYPFVYKKHQLGFMCDVTHFIQKLILVAPSPYKED